jgi:hypothetical protein
VAEGKVKRAAELPPLREVPNSMLVGASPRTATRMTAGIIKVRGHIPIYACRWIALDGVCIMLRC